MNQIIAFVWRLRIWSDTRGQDLIEYALMAALVAVVAGGILPNVSSSISQVFSKLGRQMTSAVAAS